MVKESWILIRKGADFGKIAKENNIDPVTARVIINRGVPATDVGTFLSAGTKQFIDPYKLKDIEKAADVIISSIKGHEKIRVIGDYDVDGINSTYILLMGLRRAGAEADYAIPNRVEDGYGVNSRMIDKAKEDGIDTVITCDNGIAAFDAIKHAKELSMKAVVTDHHTVPYEEKDGERIDILPPADAVVDPHRSDCPYPFKDICGGVVAWKFIIVLYEKLGIPSSEADVFISNAAFATVCDVMPLTLENRAIVKEGLLGMKKDSPLGMKALITRCGLDDAPLMAWHMGFILGPCFNATGRIDSADMAMNLLLSKTPEEASSRALSIVTMNEERKAMTEKGVRDGLSLIEDYDLQKYPVIVLFIPDIHESICGLVAGRIKEATNHPVFVLTRGEDCAKGSGRSIEAYPMYDRMKICEDLFIKWGGHPMAAGLSMKEEDIDAFRERMNEAPSLTEKDFQKKIMIDCDMPLSYLTGHLDLIDEMEYLEPCGTKNEKPLFAIKDIKPNSAKIIGRERHFLKFSLPAGNTSIEAVYFGDCEEMREYYENKFSKEAFDALLKGQENDIRLTIAYEASWNEFNGVKKPQIKIKHFL